MFNDLQNTKKFLKNKERKECIKGMKDSLFILLMFNIFLVFYSLGSDFFTISIYYSLATLIWGIVYLLTLSRSVDMVKFFSFEALISIVTALTCIGLSLIIGNFSVLNIVVLVFGGIISVYLAYRVILSNISETRKNSNEAKLNNIILIFSVLGIIVAKFALQGMSQVGLIITFDIGISFLGFVFIFIGSKFLIKYHLAKKSIKFNDSRNRT